MVSLLFYTYFFILKTIFLAKIRDFPILIFFYLIKYKWYAKLPSKIQLWEVSYLSSFWHTICLLTNKTNRTVAKLFSISANVPKFLNRFPDAKLLYMIRDPLNVLPSGLSLVTGVLDKRFGFWSLPKEKRTLYIGRLYKALVQLLLRFHSDWVNDKIDKTKVMIIRYDRMMSDFDELMEDILSFVDYTPTEELVKEIQKTALGQRNYKSKHTYDLNKFGLNEAQIKEDCSKIYETFLS